MEQHELMLTLENLGIKNLRQRGNNIVGSCPHGSHLDRRPSWGIRTDAPHIFNCYACFPKGTQVDTVHGPRSIEDIRIGDTVVSDNMYGEVVRTITNPPAPIYRVRMALGLLSFDATPNHGIYARKANYRTGDSSRIHSFGPIEKVEVSKLNSSYYVLASSAHDVPPPSNTFVFKEALRGPRALSNVRSLLNIDEEFAELCGWYCAEGSISGNRVLNFTLNYNEVSYAKRIADLIRKLFDVPVRVSRNAKVNRADIVSCSVYLCELLEHYCGRGAETKKVPDFALASPVKLGKPFLAAYTKGDGHRASGARMCITTVSPSLAKGVSLLCLKLKLLCSSVCSPSSIKKGVSRKKAWKVYINYLPRRNLTRTMAVLDDGHAYVRVSNVTNLGIKLPVHNLTVTPLHRYSVNGLVVANCGFSGTLLNLLIRIGNKSYRQAKLIVGEEEPHVKAAALLDKFNEKRKAPEEQDEAELFMFYVCGRARAYAAMRGISKATFDKAGLLYDSQQDRIVFPWRINGKLLAATGRALRPSDARKHKLISYFENTKKRNLLYIPSGTIDRSPLVIVEGEFDALKVYEAGYTNVAALGHSDLSDAQRNLLLNSPCTEIRAFTDNDSAGDKAFNAIKEGLGKNKIVKRIDYSSLFGEYSHLRREDGTLKLDPGMLDVEEIKKLLSEHTSLFPEWDNVTSKMTCHRVTR